MVGLSLSSINLTQHFHFNIPGCRYQFVNTRDDIIPTINLSKKCPKDKCSKPINAPFDKTKQSCQFSWVNYLENGTWIEQSVRKFQDTFQLQASDYFSNNGYMYSLEVSFVFYDSIYFIFTSRFHLCGKIET